ncbi:Stk1 family PASTA domain-containing Ser/Thr kinase [Secundilactobacillus folii]|uniref:non-specific serine/threonine protein kinase n=1 Tax=Secundilactobacillus folii TaxID=2678357 RepID=A0A7X2XU31_9LACO|nr:Stk1 family PASTA domain-containing Ser/Thr kinase [Secundilactobacillus folii]MTV81100.1 Stk1 family PASTA domain-containing Ser/Thr kinase [Secundilactobacillus folii]
MRPNYVLGGRYKILKALGEGGMANVYLAHDLILDRDVSVKLLRLDLRDDPHTIKRFQREGLAATELVHPNIVSVYDVGEENGMQYMVMEYVKGMDLKAYIKKHFPIPYQEVINIMEQVLSAVQVAHEHNIIHRDLKPQNILIDEQGTAKITDFGIAVAMSENSLTQTNTVLGSVHYLSPEQARGGMATKKSDIYSLGIILYELLTGTVPFKGETAVSIAIKHFQSEIPSVREFDPRIPQALENVVLKATSKRPADRYETVADMASDLKTSLSPRRASEAKFVPNLDADDGETKVLDKSELHSEAVNQPLEPKATADSSPGKSKKKRRHRRRWVALLAGLLIILIAAVGLAFWLGRTQTVSVPDLSGMTVQQARDKLTAVNLDTGSVKRQTSTQVKKNRIIKTSPKASTQAKQNSKVNLFVSDGPRLVTIGNYVGQSYTRAAAVLEAKGVTVRRQNRSSSEVPIGTVMQQSVATSKRIDPKKETVTLTVSAGQRELTLATLIGKTKSAIQRYATSESLNVTFNYKYSNDKKDTAIEQSPGGGSTVREGSTISVTLSRGKRPVDSSQPKVEDFSVSVDIPFEASSSSSSDSSSSSSSASESDVNTVQIYVRDHDHDYSTVYKQLTISQDTQVTIPFAVESGKSGGYRIVRNGKVIQSDNNVTKNSH